MHRTDGRYVTDEQLIGRVRQLGRHHQVTGTVASIVFGAAHY